MLGEIAHKYVQYVTVHENVHNHLRYKYTYYS